MIKKDKSKKEVKVIAERINALKEIKSEKKEEKKEEIHEHEIDDDFHDFSNSRRTAPVLQASNQPIERQLENVPTQASSKKSNSGASYSSDSKVYNAPNYSSSYEQKNPEPRTVRTSRDVPVLRRDEQFLDLVRRQQEVQQTQQRQVARSDEERKYHPTQISTGEEERRMPARRDRRK